MTRALAELVRVTAATYVAIAVLLFVGRTYWVFFALRQIARITRRAPKLCGHCNVMHTLSPSQALSAVALELAGWILCAALWPIRSRVADVLADLEDEGP